MHHPGRRSTKNPTSCEPGRPRSGYELSLTRPLTVHALGPQRTSSPTRRLSSATPQRATHVYHRERGTGALCTAMPTADLLARDLTGDTISPRGLRASAGHGIGSARIRHRTCA
jgi:hypothetical protein